MKRAFLSFFALLFAVSTLTFNLAHAQSLEFELPSAFKEVLATAKGGDLKTAEKALKIIKKEQGESANYYFVKGALAPFKLEKASIVRLPFIVKGMRKDWEKAIKIDPHHEPANFSLALYYASAPSMFSGDPEKAQAILDLFKERGSELQYPLEANLLLVTDAPFEDLEASFLKWIAYNPSQPAPRLNFVVTLISLEKYDLAAEQIAEIDPLIEGTILASEAEQLQIHYQYGKLAAESGLYLEQGRQHLEWLIANDKHPNDINFGYVHIRLAKVLLHLGEKGEAQLQRNLAVPYKPKDKMLFELIDDFDALSAEAS